MEQRTSADGVRRRQVLQGAAVLATTGGSVTALSGTAAADGEDLASWFSDVDNYDGLVDQTGQSEVTIEVGVAGNGGNVAFGPAAVSIDPGTTVVWEWTGEGGSHDVAAEDDSFASELLSEGGATFEHTFEGSGVTRYACTPHKTMGMKGAVVVGDAETGLEETKPPMVAREPDYGDWFANTDNFQGTVDMTGREEVRIECVAEGEDGERAFTPPAVHVDPGTRVIWEWSGDGPDHAIEAADGSYASPEQASGEWGQRFDGTGISKYRSTAFDDQGMRGAVVVGDIFEGIYDVSVGNISVAGLLGAAALSPIAFGAFLLARGKRDHPSEDPDR